MYEFGDGCVLDSESVGNYPHVDLRTPNDPVPAAIEDTLKSACERWYREDQQKALLLEQIRRKTGEVQVRYA